MGIIKCVNRKCRYFDAGEPDNCSHPLGQIQVCIDAIVQDVTVSKSKNFYLDELRSNQCVCEKPKKPKHSFCPECFYKLPRDLQVDLYLRMREGYEEAYAAAVNFLEESA